MTEFIQTLLISNIYRILCLATGFAIAYLGYRLFMAGISQRSGETDVQAGGWRLTLKNMAPGSFFAICGVIIAFLGAVRPVTVERGAGNGMSVTYPPATSDISFPQTEFGTQRASFAEEQKLAEWASIREKLETKVNLTDNERKELIEILPVDSAPKLKSTLDTNAIISETSYQSNNKWYEFWK